MFPQKTYTLTQLATKTNNWINNLTLTQLIVLSVLGGFILAQTSPPRIISYFSKPKPIPRKDFAESTKKFTLMMQGNVCNCCKKPTNFWDFHHRDGNRSNNNTSNCEALCPYCHAEKTRKKL